MNLEGLHLDLILSNSTVHKSYRYKFYRECPPRTSCSILSHLSHLISAKWALFLAFHKCSSDFSSCFHKKPLTKPAEREKSWFSPRFKETSWEHCISSCIFLGLFDWKVYAFSWSQCSHLRLKSKKELCQLATVYD